MDVILKQDYGKLGKTMDVVSVKEGYARNFLFPRGIAVLATEGNRKAVAEAKKVNEKREGKKIKEAGELAQKIEKVPCTIPVKVGEEDKMYGSVGSQEICDFLKKEGFDIERSKVMLEEPIKQLGVYTIDIDLYKDVIAHLKVWVVKDQGS
ncbi:MAG: 50S ribosomal protein L9 [Chitinivibrionales bacterium]|nr:50S ribosomal protein L9 [Chitinivibrionales bacterium]